MELILVRHAIADDRDPLRFPDDRQRPLSDRGVRRFRDAARGLAAIVPDVRVVLTSPLVRARQTAAILTAAGWPDATPLPALAPEGTPAAVAEAIAPYPQPVVALVGHEPALSQFAGYLIAGGWPTIDLRKGGALCITFDGSPTSGTGTLRWLLTPRILRDLASVSG